ncbi:MAG: DUF2442 domain-containing protein [Gallionella sp.]|nr:DUF2442 domain-containing protein [Gallionella sp.]MDD4945503.1 DUF2442 domain-containing protein [Gallionella sp.]
MIKIIAARYLTDFQIALTFSTGQEGVFNGRALLQRSGPLLEPLRSESYYSRVFIDAGALCWPNGLELSPARIYESCKILESA